MKKLILISCFVLLAQISRAQSPPTITDVSPGVGDPGTIVTISGTGFSAVPGSNSVWFGAVKAGVLTSSPTTLTVSVPYGASHHPISVTVDSLTAFSTKSFLVTFDGNGGITSGSFQPAVYFPSGGSVYKGTIGDMDGDGKPDIAEPRGNGSVSIFRNTSSPGSITPSSFASPVSFSVGSLPLEVVAADMDGDGDLDLVSANNSSGSITVLRNGSSPGSITFTRQDIPQYVGSVMGVAVSDIDLDGRPDIVVSGFPVRAAVLRNTSTAGVISFAPKIDAATDGGFFGIKVGDIDGDGKPDLIGAKATEPNMDGFVAVFRNLSTPGNIAFAGANSFAVGRRYPRSVTIGDLDGDGRLDVAMSTGLDYLIFPKSISILRNTSVTDSVSFDLPIALNTHDGGGAWSVDLGDLDGDARLDIAISIDSIGVAATYRNMSTVGGLAFDQRVDFLSGAWPVGIDVGDLDLDGKPDLVLGLENGNGITIHRNAAGYTGPGPDLSWLSSVVVSDSCGDSDTLTFGQSPEGSDGIDSTLGEVNLPPLPPSGGFDARFILPVTPSKTSLKDIRSDSLETIFWRLTFQGCTYPFIFEWDATSFPEGEFRLTDEVDGTIVSMDMRAQSSLTLGNMSINSLRIEYSRASCSDLKVAPRWNLVSAPTTFQDMSVQGIFPGALSAGYRFDSSGYTLDTTLSPGVGYWMKFAVADTFTRCSEPFSSTDIDLSTGWNLFGPYDFPVAVAHVSTTPPGIVRSPVFGYRGGYEIADTLQVGRGYWVYTNSPGTLHLTGALRHQHVEGEENDDWVELAIQDAEGFTTKLFLAPQEALRDLLATPPSPPAGAMDVRFGNNAIVGPLSAGSYQIRFEGVSYPLRIVPRNVGKNNLRLSMAATRAHLEEGRAITVADGNNVSINIDGDQFASLDYKLAQNFPNPFNPSTTIDFALPNTEHITIRVYDVLGRAVATLMDERKVAGTYSVEWDATGYSSAVYFCRLDAGTYTKTIKMSLLK